MYRIIIAGSRNFDNYEAVKETMDKFISYKNIKNTDIIEIVSGCARGADTLGEKLASDNNIKCKRFPAQWNKYGNSAGFRRNVQMAEYAKEEDGVLMAFWDGKSEGTQHMINIAAENNLDVIVFRY